MPGAGRSKSTAAPHALVSPEPALSAWAIWKEQRIKVMCRTTTPSIFARRAWGRYLLAVALSWALMGSASAAVPPALVSASLTDVSMIQEISKFRSGAGHDFSYDPTFPFGASDATEPPSSMKHYFAPWPAYSGDRATVPVHAPFAGEITRVTEETNGAITNKRVEIQSASHPAYLLVLFHIDLDEKYPQIWNDWPADLWPAHQPDDTTYITRTVAAGDLLGYADMRSAHDFDVAVLWTDTDDARYWISYFDLVPASLFSQYANRGVTRSSLTISKTDRLATPVTWWGGRNDDDWVALAVPAPIPAWTSALTAGGMAAIGYTHLRRSRRRSVEPARDPLD